ncbi:MAG TPA: hypothetical protein ENH88_22865 [Pseudoalteromonas prydzensis]|uniref:Uncharacterized protein n=1 Tax=Pseudoalteromonas prydzensis TaxID=182141 RepID=A0A7V1D3I5_9GAMM|nr:hypothetical protein [Pseudoalteromonas prydzensis]HEA19241.1 hypothetical protein [Pseudoalteromonas prydzensis]
MSKLEVFDLPANISDLPSGPLEDKFRELWSTAVNQWTNQSIKGGSRPLDNDRDWYYNPLDTDLSQAGAPAVVRWTAFPNRINVLFPNSSETQRQRYADEGPPNVNGQPYQPAGPRGWQDEYCEWSVTRDNNDNISKVDFTCENPEYFSLLWRVSPDAVVDIYRKLTGMNVTRANLEDSAGNYNKKNEFNNNTTNGAVTLISPPNTLPAEIYLAAAATITRECEGKIVTNKNQLIQCSQYGTPGRNSDPTIGSAVNRIIRSGGLKASLANPVGLYIQTPDFSSFQLPPNAPIGKTAADYWRVVRGHTGDNYDQILHAVFEVPESEGFTVSDITIDGVPISFGSQITQKFQIALAALAVPTANEPQNPRPCIGDLDCSQVGGSSITNDDLAEIDKLFKERNG